MVNEKIRIGILGTSDIAFKRFLPALIESPEYEYIGVASRNIEKTKKFTDVFGGKGFDSYDALIETDEVDAVYVPLPPALHYQWGKKVLEHGKHLFMEKPFSLNPDETNELIALANVRGLVVHENYMFVYHRQLQVIQDILRSGKIGDIRLIRTAFGFPFRGTTDFRYNKELGGGALLDCGGYPIKLASLLLGEKATVTDAHLGYVDDFDVEIYGSAVLVNNSGTVAQIAFGMDNSYKCELEIWGSEGCLKTERIFTPPSDFTPIISIEVGGDVEKIAVEPDNQFKQSLILFYHLIQKDMERENECMTILKQAQLLSSIKKYNKNNKKIPLSNHLSRGITRK